MLDAFWHNSNIKLNMKATFDIEDVDCREVKHCFLITKKERINMPVLEVNFAFDGK